jgi:hypothetical protein
MESGVVFAGTFQMARRAFHRIDCFQDGSTLRSVYVLACSLQLRTRERISGEKPTSGY